jgi:beta-glucosidase
LNEPIVFVLGGYLGGLIPPGERRFSAAASALQNLLRAHAAASAAIRQRISGAQVGMAHNMLDFAPDRPGSSWDRKLVAAAERLYNLSLVEAIATGRMRTSRNCRRSPTFSVSTTTVEFICGFAAFGVAWVSSSIATGTGAG